MTKGYTVKKEQDTLTFSKESNPSAVTITSPKDLLLEQIAKLDEKLEAKGMQGFSKLLSLMLSAGEVTSFSQQGLPPNQFRITLDRAYTFEAFDNYDATVYLPKQMHVELLFDTLEVKFPGNCSSNITGPYGKKMAFAYGYIDTLTIHDEDYTQTVNVFGGYQIQETKPLANKMQEWEARIKRFQNQPAPTNTSSWSLW